MRLTFRATTAAFQETEYALVCGVTGEDQYLVFQRVSEDSADDWGLHLEYGDRASSDYEKVAKCVVTRQRLRVDLSAQLGTLEGVDGFDVEFTVDNQAFAAFREGLRRVFRGKLELLQVE